MEEVKIDVDKLGDYVEMMKKEERKVTLTHPEKTMDSKRKCTIIYRTLNLKTLNLKTKRIDIAKEEEIMEVLENLRSKIVFYARGSWGSRSQFTSEDLVRNVQEKQLKRKNGYCSWRILATEWQELELGEFLQKSK